ncbi:MAG TPA: WYL domain-containing protein, partial [Candidatus Limnocylindrales bacterium]|nr:WYL domain-containing protein [Candidatus Limnocylindrales bacterium]
LAGAARDHRRSRFYYEARDGERTLRDVEPHWLVQVSGRWYLVAWDVDRWDWRTFRVDRVGSPRPPGSSFRPRPAPGGDVAGYVTSGIVTAQTQVRATVRLPVPAETLAGQIWPDWGVLEAIDDRSCLFHIGGQSPETLVLLLGMLGVDFELVEAPGLSGPLREIGHRYLRAASSAGS